MRRHLSNRNRERQAVAAVELALVMPVVAILVAGLLDLGRIVQVNEILNNAAREGARKASTGINTFADVQTTVANYLTNAGIANQTGLTVTIYNVTQGNLGPSYNPSTANYLDQLKVTVSMPFSNVQFPAFHFYSTGSNTMLTANAVWFSNQNQSYPVTITPPAGN